LAGTGAVLRADIQKTNEAESIKVDMIVTTGDFYFNVGAEKERILK
jgi:hypothetical protein